MEPEALSSFLVTPFPIALGVPTANNETTYTPSMRHRNDPPLTVECSLVTSIVCFHQHLLRNIAVWDLAGIGSRGSCYESSCDPEAFGAFRRSVLRPVTHSILRSLEKSVTDSQFSKHHDVDSA